LIFQMETRGDKNVYLIGSYTPEILGAKLPSYRQAFGHFLHLHKEEKNTVANASRDAIQAVSTMWVKAGIPVRSPQHAIKKLQSVFFEWKGLQKHKSRKTPAHKDKEEAFVSRLDDLFDIAHEHALSTIINPEDRAFLLSQRLKGRPGSIGALDKVHEVQTKRAQERLDAETRRKKRSKEEMEAATSQVVLTDEDESSPNSPSTEKKDAEEQDYTGAVGSSATPKRARIDIMSPGLASALDKTKMSSRNAMFVLSEAAATLGHDVGSLNINRNSIHRARARLRANTANNLRSEFSASVPLTGHWDGKLMADLTTKEHVDRLPVLISGAGVEQLLGVPKLSTGTGEAQAAAVVRCFEEWGITGQVAALCFDTTASNTGHRSGACSLIEQKLGKDLLYMACRHHVMELVVGAAFEKTSVGISTGPDILIFKRFQGQWQFIDRDNFKPASTDPSVETLVSSSRADILEFAQMQLETKQPRDDYREFLELSIIFIGGLPTRGIHFQVPGAMHHARWMAKVIYVIKIWLFRHQFKMTKSEERGICDMAVFAVLVHLKAWMTAPVTVEAPLNDFRLMSQLLKYHQPVISTATTKKLGLHLWYLSEELIGLALFDARVPIESKKLMVAAMGEAAPDHPPKRPRVASAAFLGDKGLEQFCTANSKRLFQLLGLSEEFLAKDPAEWEDEDSFKAAFHAVKHLAVSHQRQGGARRGSYPRLQRKTNKGGGATSVSPPSCR
jgi:hypothetical protein